MEKVIAKGTNIKMDYKSVCSLLEELDRIDFDLVIEFTSKDAKTTKKDVTPNLRYFFNTLKKWKEENTPEK